MTLVVRLLVAFGLTWAIGFERELRGSPAGDRTFSLIGIGSAVIGYLALDGAPNALAGVVTGIGFLGAGVIVRTARPPHAHSPAPAASPDVLDPDDPPGTADDAPPERIVQGVTTAATIYTAAAVGAAAGQGRLALATLAAAMTVLLLEIRHQPILRVLDGGYWRTRLGMRGSDDTT